MRLPPANCIKSAIPTPRSAFILGSSEQMPAIPASSGLEHSPARIREPSQPLLKQSWNAALMAWL